MPGMYKYSMEIESNVKKLLLDTKELQDRMDTLEGKEYKINLNIDEKKLGNVISNLEKMLDSLGKGTGDFKQFENLSKELSSIVSEVQSLSKAFGKVDDSGAKTLLSSIQNIDKSLSELSQNILNVNKNMNNMGGNTSGAVKQVENITNESKKAASALEDVAKAQEKINGQKTNISFGDSTSNAIDTQVKKQREYNDLVAVGYDRIQKMKRISESGTTGQNSVYDLLRLNHEAWDEVKANNFFNTIPEEGLKRYTKILEVVEKIVQEMVQASGLTEDQIVSQLKNIKSAQGGNFKLNGADSGWTHFATYSNGQKDSMQKPNGITYKVYAAFDDIKDLNQNVVSSIMDELTKAGFKGRLKTTSGSTSFGDKLNGLAITDQMVVHGSTKKDQEIAYNTLKNMGLKLSYLGGGIDTPDGSFSQTLASGEINKYVQGLEKEATTARDTAKAEQELANARKESTSTVSQNQKKDAFPKTSENLEQVAQSEQKVQQEAKSIQSKWEQAEKAIHNYMNAVTKLNNLKTSDKGTGKKSYEIAGQIEEIEKLKKEAYDARQVLSSMINPQNVDTDTWKRYVDVINRLDQASNGSAESVNRLKDSLKNTLNSELNSLQNSIDKYQNIITKAQTYPSDFHPSTEYNTRLANLESANNALKDYKASLQGITELTKDQQNQINKLTQNCEKAATEFKNLSAVEKGTVEVGIEKAIQRINKDLAENTKYSAEAKATLNALLKQLKSGDPSINLRKITEEIIKIENAEIAAGRAGKSLWDIFKTKSTYGFIGQMQSYLSMYVGFYGMVNAVRESISTITELDTALVDLKKTTVMNENQLENFYYDSNKVAKQMGVTTKEIIDQASAWSRLGYNTAETSTTMAKLSSQFASISPGMSVDESQSGLVSIMKAKFYALIYSNVYLEYI